MSILFISDLHLDSARPALTDLFIQFLRSEAVKADALYILGDLFEVWVGDDDSNPDYRMIRAELRSLTDSGVPAYVMHGNRDFLIGGQFESDTGCTLIDEYTIIDLFGEPTLLLHGDSLCTDDHEHMATRSKVRTREWRDAVLSRPLEERIETARGYREISKQNKRYKPEDIMDVNRNTVKETLRDYQVKQMIHGHTHRPAFHEIGLDDGIARRIVLGDWGDTLGSVLVCSQDGCTLEHYTPDGFKAATAPA